MLGGNISSIMSYGGGGDYDCWNVETAYNVGKLALVILALYFLVFFVLNMDPDREAPVRVSAIDEQMEKVKL